MNSLLKKEIRLLMPACLAVLLLEMALPWVMWDHESLIQAAPPMFFLGMVLLAVDSFGREFSLVTFTVLMVQPVERQNDHWVWQAHAPQLAVGLRSLTGVSLLGMLAAITGGLWSSLMLRRISTAFWIALLAPFALLLPLTYFLAGSFKKPRMLGITPWRRFTLA